MANEVAIIETSASQLAEKIEVLVTEARQKVASVANTAQVYTYYEIGRYIIEDEQGGKARAEYGKGVLKRVSERLTERLGRGWSEENLRLMRKFYTLYSHVQSPILKIRTSGSEIQSPKIQTSGSEIQNENRNHRLRNYQFVLPWAHYLILTHVSDTDARRFYEIEAFKQQWSKRQLQRQIGSGLYERLALSRDKDEVMRLAVDGQMQMYVNYYDRYVKEDFEKPTIGILLCERKNDALVELTLPKDANIYAQQYALCLPDKALLQQKLREWIAEFKEKEGEV